MGWSLKMSPNPKPRTCARRPRGGVYNTDVNAAQCSRLCPPRRVVTTGSRPRPRDEAAILEMDRLKSTFNNMIKSVQYRRFTQQCDDDSNRHVEIKLSNDAGDDNTEMEQNDMSPTFRPAPRGNNRRIFCLLAVGFLVAFILGYFVAYVSHKKLAVDPVSCGNQSAVVGEVDQVQKEVTVTPPQPEVTVKTQPEVTVKTQPEPEEEVDPHVGELPLNWQDIVQLLDNKLTTEAFDARLKEFDVPSRLAGGEGDIHQGNLIADEFRRLRMQSRTDVHYVQLQKPDSKRPNIITFGSKDFKPEGYLAYSATGKVEGKLVYGGYGRPEDLDTLQNTNIEVKGSVLLLRAGKHSFAEQVANAEARGASAVLIYPDREDYKFLPDTALYGHVHLGSGDPYTPGFPSFNHTQFPPTQSSALPKILAQTITANMANTLQQTIGGPNNLGGVANISVEVNNVLVNTELHNVFGVIQGFVDPDQYVVLGAQRDAWGKGYARAGVGSSVLLELANAISEMVTKDGFRPRRSLVFASWSAGEYGSVGATEFLEDYLSSLDKRMCTYINLDGMVMGHGGFIASASPLLYNLLEDTMKEVRSPIDSGTVYDMVGTTKWETNVLRPMSIDDPAYPFLAFAGIPSISFHFITPNVESYEYYGTSMDNMDHLKYNTAQRTSETTVLAAQFAGHMALRLVHDRLLRLDVSGYRKVLPKALMRVYRHVYQLVQSGDLKGVDPDWLENAHGTFQRAVANLNTAILHTDLSEDRACRLLNERLMSVEQNLLSPYVSPVETPFRHILLGRGPHTLASIAEMTDLKELHTQLAFATWSVKGCANGMSEIWEEDDS
ncbi:transferrin receptor 1b isoform X2 [Nerophis lumbriciformis]|uniref:transferrin receptor 1b isoform X2 n=1 Tax=Nerophis lumbriciformis TaxID=546530 RepID=UPI002ADF5214|nr:transferrin receptor protein 1-like isoform X2 [Nerophis lumbriciformis]